jgi:hypothetical protein
MPTFTREYLHSLNKYKLKFTIEEYNKTTEMLVQYILADIISEATEGSVELSRIIMSICKEKPTDTITSVSKYQYTYNTIIAICDIKQINLIINRLKELCPDSDIEYIESDINGESVLEIKWN